MFLVEKPLSSIGAPLGAALRTVERFAPLSEEERAAIIALAQTNAAQACTAQAPHLILPLYGFLGLRTLSAPIAIERESKTFHRFSGRRVAYFANAQRTGKTPSESRLGRHTKELASANFLRGACKAAAGVHNCLATSPWLRPRWRALLAHHIAATSSNWWPLSLPYHLRVASDTAEHPCGARLLAGGDTAR